MENIPVINHTMDLTECRDKWTYNEKYDCWCLEDVLYTPKATVPAFQRLSIFVPKAYLNADGTVCETGKVGAFTAKTVPVVFGNNSAGYSQMPHTWLDGPRCSAGQYLERGLVYVTCGCRGKDSPNALGKAPATLVDLKTAIRFLRHNKAALPGDWDKIVSVGWSAGGAMSALLGVTGDHESFDRHLEENGAFMEESDSVFAAQIYCPIIDLEHADMAYEWMFRADKESEPSPAGPAETMTPFKEALSKALSDRYVTYFNGLGLHDPDTGETLTLSPDGRGGTAYDYLMARLNDSATDFLTRLAAGKLPAAYTVEKYLAGDYTYEKPGPRGPRPGGPGGPGGPQGGNGQPMTLGERMLRPAPGAAPQPPAGAPPTVTVQGNDKRDWLAWDCVKAEISDLDAYVLNHRRRMKPCTSFDTLPMRSGENQVFGDKEHDFTHFSAAVADALESLREEFPAEWEQYRDAYAAAFDPVLAERVRQINPLTYIGTGEKCRQTAHYRIRVGACDADTSFMVSLTLALKLANAGFENVDYALVWDQPHCEADYPGEVCGWIEEISK